MLRIGRFYGFPWCCRVRYALRAAHDPEGEQAVERGVRFAPSLTPYVPCGVLHRRALTAGAFERIVAALDGWPPPELGPEHEPW